MTKLISSELKCLASLIILAVATLPIGGCAPANQPPIISSLTASKEQIAPAGICQLECIASDQDGDSLSYIWSAGGSSISGEGSVITWTAPEAPATYGIMVKVTDGRGGEAAAQLTIDVVAINHPPVIESLIAEPSSVLQGKTSVIECVASDPDRDKLSYSWSTTRGNISGQGSKVTWLTPNTCGTYFITVTVADGRGGEASKKLEIKVIKPG